MHCHISLIDQTPLLPTRAVVLFSENMLRLKSLATPIERYLQLRTLAAENVPAYYQLLLNHTEEVGLQYSHQVTPA